MIDGEGIAPNQWLHSRFISTSVKRLELKNDHSSDKYIRHLLFKADFFVVHGDKLSLSSNTFEGCQETDSSIVSLFSLSAVEAAVRQ